MYIHKVENIEKLIIGLRLNPIFVISHSHEDNYKMWEIAEKYNYNCVTTDFDNVTELIKGECLK